MDLAGETLDILSQVNIEAFRLLEDEADEPHGAHNIPGKEEEKSRSIHFNRIKSQTDIRFRIDGLKLLGIDVS